MEPLKSFPSQEMSPSNSQSGVKILENQISTAPSAEISNDRYTFSISNTASPIMSNVFNSTQLDNPAPAATSQVDTSNSNPSNATDQKASSKNDTIFDPQEINLQETKATNSIDQSNDDPFDSKSTKSTENK